MKRRTKKGDLEIFYCRIMLYTDLALSTELAR